MNKTEYITYEFMDDEFNEEEYELVLNDWEIKEACEKLGIDPKYWDCGEGYEKLIEYFEERAEQEWKEQKKYNPGIDVYTMGEIMKTFECEICHCITPKYCEGSEPNTCAMCKPLIEE